MRLLERCVHFDNYIVHSFANSSLANICKQQIRRLEALAASTIYDLLQVLAVLHDNFSDSLPVAKGV